MADKDICDIFISWSGDDAKEIARELKDFFAEVLATKAFCSDLDIPAGDVWEKQIHDQLVNSKFGVVVLVKSNLFEPWLFYEAGGIRFGRKNCCPLLFGVKDVNLTPPFKTLEHKTFNKQSFNALVMTIKKAIGNKEGETVVNKRFELSWREFEPKVNAILANEQNLPRIVERESQPELPETLEVLRIRCKTANHSDMKIYSFRGIDDSQILDHVEPADDLETVYYLWADAQTGDTISAQQKPYSADEMNPQGRLYLRVRFNYHGGEFPPNVAVRPAGRHLLKAKSPEGFRRLSFEARIPSDESKGTADAIQVALRIIDGFTTHWNYRRLEHMRWFDLTDVGVWKRHEISLEWKPDFWEKFQYDGNYWYAGDKPDFSRILAVVILVRKIRLCGGTPIADPGCGVIDIRDWQVN